MLLQAFAISEARALFAFIEDLLGREISRVEVVFGPEQDRALPGSEVVAEDRRRLREADVIVEGLRVAALAGEAAGRPESRPCNLARGFAGKLE